MGRKIVYIAHQISGNVAGNIARIRRIMRTLYLEQNVVPFAPYLEACGSLDDDKPEERVIGMAASEEFFKRGTVDEVWLFGSRISSGMRQEILLAWKLGIPVIAQTTMTALELQNMRGVNLTDPEVEKRSD